MKVKILIDVNDHIEILEYWCTQTTLENEKFVIYNAQNILACFNFNNIIGYEHFYDQI